MSGQHAQECGMVNALAHSLDALDATVNEIVTRLAAGGPDAMRATKKLLNEIDGSLDERMVLRGAELSAQVLATPDAQQRLRAKLAS